MSTQDSTTSIVVIHIKFIDGDSVTIECDPSHSINSYSTYAEAAYENGTLKHDGWFTVIDTDKHFHAIPLSQIRHIETLYITYAKS